MKNTTNMTDADLAFLFGVSKMTIGHWNRGDRHAPEGYREARKNPTFRKFAAVAAMYREYRDGKQAKKFATNVYGLSEEQIYRERLVKVNN